jgi:hypothetical protein
MLAPGVAVARNWERLGSAEIEMLNELRSSRMLLTLEIMALALNDEMEDESVIFSLPRVYALANILNKRLNEVGFVGTHAKVNWVNAQAATRANIWTDGISISQV